MSQAQWVSLSRYNLKAGFRVLEGKLFPVIDGSPEALEKARTAIESLGFRQLRSGGFAIRWADLPAVEAWEEAFPAAMFSPLADLATEAALGTGAREQMVARGLVAASAFPDEPDQSINVTQEEPAKTWPWLNLEAYGLETVIRSTDAGPEIRVEGPQAAKHLAKGHLATAGAVISESREGLVITIP